MILEELLLTLPASGSSALSPERQNSVNKWRQTDSKIDQAMTMPQLGLMSCSSSS